jgi:hypothetical protein
MPEVDAVEIADREREGHIGSRRDAPEGSPGAIA